MAIPPRTRSSGRLLAAAAVVAAGAGWAVVAGSGPGAPQVVAGSGPGAPQVVAISVRPAAGPAGRATGVVLGPGRVLTVAHVLAGEEGVAVRGPDGVARRASVLRTDPQLDLALLEVRGMAGSAPSVAEAATSARILVARGGAVRPLPATIRRRITARLVDQAGRPRRPSLELAATVRSGDSGAPVVSGDGRIVGIVYARSSRRAGTAYAVRGPGLRRLVCGTC